MMESLLKMEKRPSSSKVAAVSALTKGGVEIPIILFLTMHMRGKRDKFISARICDLCEREEETLNIQKTESVSNFVIGLAHDFKTKLTAAMGVIAHSKMELKESSKVYSRLLKAEEAILRMRELTEQLFTFSLDGETDRSTVSTKELIIDTIELANVRCQINISDNLWSVDIDQRQMSQVIRNLLDNCNQTMADGGHIKLVAENMVMAEVGFPNLKAGKYIKITVKELKPGKQKKHIHKVFDPFSNTKQIMSDLIYEDNSSLMRDHGGQILTESNQEEGVSFHAYIPASLGKVVIEEKRSRPPFAGQGRILIMDDDDLVRYTTGELLKKYGYDVQLARDGSQAIQLYVTAKELGQPFDAVILDLEVPGGMGGEETIQRLLTLDKNIKAIVSSGYSDEPIMAKFREYGFCGSLPKPYKIDDLKMVLHDVIKGK